MRSALTLLISACLAVGTAVINSAAAGDSAASRGGARSSLRSKSLERHLRFNQRLLSAPELRAVEQIEVAYRFRLQDGDYWYDSKSGAAGKWGGPTLAILPPGLSLGGPLPANASGGGTRVFINGREIHPIDLHYLQQLLRSPVMPGRYWVDAQGNGGLEGGPPIVNLYAAARQQHGGGSGGGNRPWSYHSEWTGRPGDNINGASDGQTTCFTTAGRTVCNDGNN